MSREIAAPKVIVSRLLMTRCYRLHRQVQYGEGPQARERNKEAFGTGWQGWLQQLDQGAVGVDGEYGVETIASACISNPNLGSRNGGTHPGCLAKESKIDVAPLYKIGI